MTRKSARWILVCLGVLGLLVAACGASEGDRALHGLGRDPFSARSESENGIVVEWSGYTEDYQLGQKEKVELRFINDSDEMWQAKYCLLLLDTQGVVATLGEREFALDPGAAMATPHYLDFSHNPDLGDGAYGLAFVVHRPQGPAVNSVTIRIGDTDEIYRPEESVSRAALAACPPAGRTEISTMVDLSPEEVVQAFYRSYIDHARAESEAGIRHSPLVDDVYRSSPYLSQAFVQKVDEILASFRQGPAGGYDPILCAQDVPESISIAEATVSSREAEVIVETNLGNHSFALELEMIDEQWKIADVNCSAPRGTASEVEQLVDLALADLAVRLDIRPDLITVQRVEPIEFPDTSLAVPEPDRVYAPVVTPGYVIELTAEGAAYRYHGAGDRVVLVTDAGESPSGSITIRGVQVTAGERIVIHGSCTLSDGTCLATELWAEGEPQSWWPENVCVPVRDGAWRLAVLLGQGGAPVELDAAAQYIVRAYQQDGPRIVAVFPFDLAGPNAPNP